MNHAREIELFKKHAGHPEIAGCVISMLLFRQLTKDLIPQFCRSSTSFRLRDEITQEAWRTIYCYLCKQLASDYSADEDVESYLTRLIRRHLCWARDAVLRGERRMTLRRTVDETDIDDINDVSAPVFISEREYKAAIHTAVAVVLAMETQLRRAAWMRFFENWPVPRIAAVLHISSEKVSRLLVKARNIVSTSIEDLTWQS